MLVQRVDELLNIVAPHPTHEQRRITHMLRVGCPDCVAERDPFLAVNRVSQRSMLQEIRSPPVPRAGRSPDVITQLGESTSGAPRVLDLQIALESTVQVAHRHALGMLRLLESKPIKPPLGWGIPAEMGHPGEAGSCESDSVPPSVPPHCNGELAPPVARLWFIERLQSQRLPGVAPLVPLAHHHQKVRGPAILDHLPHVSGLHRAVFSILTIPVLLAKHYAVTHGQRRVQGRGGRWRCFRRRARGGRGCSVGGRSRGPRSWSRHAA
mmetsp:Transcript_70771/g.188775  ORF Transcript_70771/g.188775 Transcript_70771/m.188775 type:complete len:267 (+) Transcript_70771:712-1512(+)